MAEATFEEVMSFLGLRLGRGGVGLRATGAAVEAQRGRERECRERKEWRKRATERQRDEPAMAMVDEVIVFNHALRARRRPTEAGGRVRKDRDAEAAKAR